MSFNQSDLGQYELSQLPLSAATSVRPAVVARSARALPIDEVAEDLSPSIAGIQQGPAILEPTPSAVEAIVVPTPTREAPTPATAQGVRRTAINAPEGFTSAFLRDAPATSARSVRQLANGTPVELLGGTAAGDGFTWVRVQTQDGTPGWVVSTAVSG